MILIVIIITVCMLINLSNTAHQFDGWVVLVFDSADRFRFLIHVDVGGLML